MNTLSLILHGKTDAYIRSLPPDPKRDLISITHLPSSTKQREEQQQREQQRQRPSLPQRSYTEYPAQVRQNSIIINHNSNSPAAAGSEGSKITFTPRFSFTRSLSEMSILPSPSSSKTLSTWSLSPSSSRRSSTTSRKSSPGWYSRENELTLEDFALKLQTRGKRFEVYMGRCAQNLVMALFSPTPLVLFLFNPVSLVVWGLLGLGWWMGWGRG